MNLEKKVFSKSCSFFPLFFRENQFRDDIQTYVENAHLKLNFWSKFQRKKKLVKSCEPFSRTVSYLFCTVLVIYIPIQSPDLSNCNFGSNIYHLYHQCQISIQFDTPHDFQGKIRNSGLFVIVDILPPTDESTITRVDCNYNFCCNFIMFS